MNEDQKAKTLKRQMAFRAELKKNGGKVATIYLSPKAHAALKRAMESNKWTAREAIERALVGLYGELNVVSSQPL